MLRISIIETGTRRQLELVLEGKLVAPWTDELKSVCLRNDNKSEPRELVIDVDGLTAISQEGEDVLLALMLKGARFRGGDLFTKQILKQLAQQLGNGNESQ
jgi:hypothetical protein